MSCLKPLIRRAMGDLPLLSASLDPPTVLFVEIDCRQNDVLSLTSQEYAIKFIVWFIRLDALALSVIATATWLAGWVGGCLSQPVLYQND